jgi:hypothetical protein
MTILAYVDPGLGALIWQAIIAAFVGFMFYLKKTRRWIGELFLKIFRRAPKAPDLAETAAKKVEIKIDPT